MYGNLRDIDLHTLLAFIEQSEWSGQLLIESSSLRLSKSTFALLYFHYGQITYAVTSTSLHLQRLQDYVRRYQIESSLENLIATEADPLRNDELPVIPSNLPEYKFLWRLLEHHVISANEGKRLLSNMIQETIFDVLSLREGEFLLKKNIPFQPRLTAFQITPLLSQTMRQLQQWKQLFPYITSPEQCPLLTNPDELKKAITPSAYRTLAVACQGQLSLRRIARYLNKDLVTISQALYPYIQRGWLQLKSDPATSNDSQIQPSSTVFCIGPPEQLSEEMELTLNEQGYTPMPIKDPRQTLSLMLQQPPALIISALEMPELAGDQLALKLRRISDWEPVPIILLTNENPDPLRVTKAQLLGKIEFLVSPFEPSELLQLLKTHCQTVSPQQPKQNFIG